MTGTGEEENVGAIPGAVPTERLEDLSHEISKGEREQQHVLPVDIKPGEWSEYRLLVTETLTRLGVDVTNVRTRLDDLIKYLLGVAVGGAVAMALYIVTQQ